MSLLAFALIALLFLALLWRFRSAVGVELDPCSWRTLRRAMLNGLGQVFHVLSRRCFEQADAPPAPIVTRLEVQFRGPRPRITAPQRPQDVATWRASVPSQILRFQRGDR